MSSHSGSTLDLVVADQPWRRHLKAVAGWTLLWVFFFTPLLLGLEHLPDGDFTGQFHANAVFQARELTAGRFPVWSQGSYAGFPFAADVQSAAYYPPRLVTVLLSMPWGLSLYALQVEALFHIWLTGLFTYCLAFFLTESRRAALLGAIAFGLGGYLTSYPLLQLAILETITWLPLVLAFLWKASRSEQPLSWLVAAGLTLAISALAGHPQTFLHVAYLAALYLLFVAMRARWTARWILLAGAIIFLVALGASAAMWLPAVQFMSYSTRASVSYEFVATGQVLLNYLQLFTPNLFTEWSPEYVGIGTLLLAAYAWFGRGELQRLDVEEGGSLQLPGGRSEIIFWTALGVITAWLALGEEGILFRLLFRVAPGFSLFRQQERLLGVVSLSWALLAAQGFSLWLRARTDTRQLLHNPTMLILAGLTLGGVFVFGSSLTDLPADSATWVRQMAIAALVLLLVWRGGRTSLASLTLLLVIGADLFLVMDASTNKQPGAAADYWQRPPWLTLLEADQRPGLPGRIDTKNQFLANVGEVYGLEDVRGVSPLRLEFVDSIMALPEWRRWQLLDVEHVISPVALSEPASLIAAVDQPLQPSRSVEAGLYRLPKSQGRAWLSYHTVQVAGPAEALAYLALPEFDAARDVVLHTPVEYLDRVETVAGGPGATGQAVAAKRIQANALKIDVATETPALLVISEWRYPGWQATIDGIPATLYPANYAFQALVVPAGNHTVELRFVPFVVLAGVLISAVTLVTALFVARAWQPLVGLREESWQHTLAPPLPPLPQPLTHVLARWSAFITANIRLLLGGMVLLGAALRLFRLGVQELRGDEAFSYLMANRPLSAVVPTLITAADPHPPLHYLLLSGSLQLAGDSEFAMRVLPALLAVLLTPLMYQFGKQMWSKSWGLLLALLVTVSQSQVWLAQDTRSQYMLALLFTILATLLLLHAVQEPNAKLWALYGLVAAVAMYSHLYSAFALLAHGAYVVSGFRRQIIAWVASGVAAFLLFLPWLLISVGGWFGQLADPGPTDLSTFSLVVFGELLVGPAMSKAIGPWPILGAGLLCAVGWQSIWRRQRPLAYFLGAWLGASVLGIFLLPMRRATLNPFYIAVAAPAWWALFCAGVRTVGSSATRTSAWRRVAAILIVLAVVALNVIALARYWGNPFTHGRSGGYRQLARYLDANLDDGDIFVANYPDPALTYYLRNVPVRFEIEPAGPAVPQIQIEQELQALANSYRRLWFVPAHQSTWEPEDVVFRWLDYNLLLEQRHNFMEIALEAYRPLRGADELLKPLGHAVNDQLRLDGAYLTVDGRPAPLERGSVTLPLGAELNVSLLWQALDQIPESYTVFVHLLDPAGRLITQHDGVPVHGTRPTETWQVGERILDEHVLVVPQETSVAEAVLVVGLYHSATVERLRFDDGLESVTLSQIQFERHSPSSTEQRP